eukprot:CAMPEP_0183336094 /NCGR_PEP_ID=MMETSP0164_2-20130417/4181_1 /TAXON_ID=221442 /ORGANISM="Coccolithus pelagicus ssp braarudi, Strain PLY182g" /LENGTH=142 /DNA_ID=CAMNT_0025505559 /DNA_START=18 /DNA_END=446 /DNA_ORIENTATION=+
MADKGPKYVDLAKAAILALKDRTGSSLVAITKYLSANHPEAKNATALKLALKAGEAKGIFIKVKSSYKLSPTAKKPPPKPKKAAAKKPAAKKSVKKTVKKTAPKKPVAKKTTASKKPAAKKAIAKKPAAKKVVKKAAKPAKK